MHSRPYIYEENFTEHGYIAPLVDKKGDGSEVQVHGELRFSYRPMPVLSRAKWQKSGTRTAEQQYRDDATMLAEQVVAWSLPQPIQPSVLLRLEPNLFSRLVAIVWGSSSTDIDPQWPEAKQKAETATIQEAAAAGVPAAVVKEVADEKNSVAG